MQLRALLPLASALLLGPVTGWAQEGLGLDLTGETGTAPEPDPGTPAAPPAQLGLDLTEGAAVELRPTIAIAPFVLEEGALETDVQLAAWFHSRLTEGATRSNAFTRVIGPDEVRETLGTALEGLTACVSADCFEEAAQSLEVERVLTGRIRRDEQGPLLVVWGFRRDAQETPEQEIRLLGENTASAWTALRPAYRVVETLAAQLAELTVKPSLAQAESRLGPRVLGTGELKAVVPDGTQTLVVTAEGYTPHQQELTLTPGQQETVEITLQPLPKVPVAAVTPGQNGRGPQVPAILQRPGLYVAAIGVVALGIATGLGASVAATNARAVDADGNGVIDITRAEMLGARRNANAANVLFVAGGVAAAGGGTWLLLSGNF